MQTNHYRLWDWLSKWIEGKRVAPPLICTFPSFMTLMRCYPFVIFPIGFASLMTRWVFFWFSCEFFTNKFYFCRRLFLFSASDFFCHRLFSASEFFLPSTFFCLRMVFANVNKIFRCIELHHSTCAFELFGLE